MKTTKTLDLTKILKILGLVSYYGVIILGVWLASKQLDILTIVGIALMFISVDIKLGMTYVSKRALD